MQPNVKYEAKCEASADVSKAYGNGRWLMQKVHFNVQAAISEHCKDFALGLLSSQGIPQMCLEHLRSPKDLGVSLKY